MTINEDPGANIDRPQTRLRILEQYHGQDDDDFREYVATVIKRKKMLLVICLITVVATLAWNITAPRVYEVSMLIAPPIMAVSDAGVQEFDSIVNIKAQIEAGAFDQTIIDELHDEGKILKFKVLQPKDSQIIKISLNRTWERADSGKKALYALLAALNRNYAPFIEDKRGRIDNQIKMTQSQIVRKEDEVRMKFQELGIWVDREKQLVKDLQDAKESSDVFLADRARLLERDKNGDAGTALLYAMTVQQNLSRFSALKSELTGLRIEKENINNGVENLKSGINEDRIGIENLKLSNHSIHNIIVVQPPSVSPKPIGPKRVLNTLLAAIAGLSMGLFVIFFIEYYENLSAR